MPASITRLLDLIVQSSSRLTPGEMVLRTALICCSIFAAVQLLSMWATNYGDRNATSKSFFLSLLLHCCFGLGWATVLESFPRSQQPEGEPQETQVQVTLTSDETHTAEQGDSRTMFNSTPVANSTQMTRVSRTDLEPTTVEEPDVTQTPTRPTIPAMADLPTRAEEPRVAPIRESVASAASAPARITMEIEQPVTEARPEVSANATRQRPAREISSVDLSSRVEPQRGAAERMAPQIEEGAVLKIPSETATDSPLPTPVGAPDQLIRRRSSPGPIPADVVDAGSDPSSPAKANTGNRKDGRFTRQGSRAVESQVDQAPATTPRPAPPSPTTDERAIASRSSAGSDSPAQPPQPQLARMEPSTVTSRPRAVRDPEPYRSRRLEQRKGIALKNGGSEESERAVEASLRWMAGIQESDGSWSASKHGGGKVKKDPQGIDRYDGGTFADTGITGLVILSYLGAGYTHEDGKYIEVVSRGINWLISQQRSNGYLGGRATKYDKMYCHSMATFALAEAYGMQNDGGANPELRDAVRIAVRYICSRQNDDGGWRYEKGEDASDMSMFGWQLMALKSAVNAGIPIPDESRRGMARFLQTRALGAHGGLAGYKLNEKPTPAMTAEALFCRQMFGVRPNDSASQEAVAYLRQNLPRLSSYDEYYWYYGTLAMFQYDGAPWEAWNGSLRDTLIGLQQTKGPQAGSWDPKGKWAGIGGRLYSTAISTMCLEVYYRFLRLYQTNDE